MDYGPVGRTLRKTGQDRSDQDMYVYPGLSQ